MSSKSKVHLAFGKSRGRDSRNFVQIPWLREALRFDHHKTPGDSPNVHFVLLFVLGGEQAHQNIIETHHVVIFLGTHQQFLGETRHFDHGSAIKSLGDLGWPEAGWRFVVVGLWHSHRTREIRLPALSERFMTTDLEQQMNLWRHRCPF